MSLQSLPARAVALMTLVFAFVAGVSAAESRSVDVELLAGAAAGDVARVRSALARGASVSARDANGRIALLAATRGNRVEAARVLIGAGSDVNAQDDMKDSAYLLAGASGHLEILRMTLAAGADLKSVNRYGGTALIPACHYGHVETVRELLKTRIDVNHVNNLGWTALLEAVILGDGGARHTEIVRLLLEAKADPNVADRDGVTPRGHAERRGFTAMAAAIASAGGR